MLSKASQIFFHVFADQKFDYSGLFSLDLTPTGVETTRRFLLEWLSYTCRYIPVGLLDVIPQRLNWRPPSYYGRDDLETLMVSDSAADWVCLLYWLIYFTIKHLDVLVCLLSF